MLIQIYDHRGLPMSLGVPAAAPRKEIRRFDLDPNVTTLLIAVATFITGYFCGVAA